MINDPKTHKRDEPSLTMFGDVASSYPQDAEPPSRDVMHEAEKAMELVAGTIVTPANPDLADKSKQPSRGIILEAGEAMLLVAGKIVNRKPANPDLEDKPQP